MIYFNIRVLPIIFVKNLFSKTEDIWSEVALKFEMEILRRLKKHTFECLSEINRKYNLKKHRQSFIYNDQ